MRNEIIKSSPLKGGISGVKINHQSKIEHYEHNYKNDCCMMVHRLLFMEIDEKDVEYVEI